MIGELKSELHAIFGARSIAIVGASLNPEKRGYQAIARLQKDGYTGRIYPINPRVPEILGHVAYTSLLEVDGPIDLALICTPATTLPGIIAQCGIKGVKGAVVLAAGFAETGPEGEYLSAVTLEAARSAKVRLIGPNTNGIFNLHNRMNLVGIPDAVPGNIGVVSQSGNMALALVAEAKQRGNTGFSTFAGVGNQLDVRFYEYLEYLGEDTATKVAVFYIEGFLNGRRFLDVCRDVASRKPVVIFKSARTLAGQEMAFSHTRSLASSFAMTRDLLRQSGAIVVEQSDKVLSTAEGLSMLPVAKGNRVAVLADGGGHATITIDALADHGVVPARISSETRKGLAEILPPTAAVHNPIDVAGGTDRSPSTSVDCAACLLEDECVDILMIVGMFGGFSTRFSESLLEEEIEASIRIGELARQYNKPVMVQSIYAMQMPEPLRVLKSAGVPLFIWPENAVRCVSELIEYSRARSRITNSPVPEPGLPSKSAQAILDKANAQNRLTLFEHEARDLLSAYGVEVPSYIVMRSHDDVREAIKAFGEVPTAVKIVSQDILHKSDAGGVLLKVAGEAALRYSYSEVIENALQYSPDAAIEGVLVSPMAESGVEVIIGVVHDETFGPILMFGLGGIFVEVLKDVSFRALPMSRADALEMISEIQSGGILDGVRGSLPINKEALVDLMMKVAEIAMLHEEISEIDLNPVVLRHDGYDVVDARMVLSSEAN